MDRKRIECIDTLRGITIFSMIAYHFTWDLVYIMGYDLPWMNSIYAYIWQQSICWSFILISGFCWSMGRHPLKNGIQTFLFGGIVTMVTLLLMPEERILFGILTLLGSAMLLLYPLDHICAGIRSRSVHVSFLALNLFLFFIFKKVQKHILFFGFFSIRLPEILYHGGYITTYLGFPYQGFYSADYFGIFPWIFLYFAGYFLYHIYDLCFSDRKQIHWQIPLFSWIGQRSIWIYLLHQPVLYGLCMLLHFMRIL